MRGKGARREGREGRKDEGSKRKGEGDRAKDNKHMHTETQGES